MNSESKDDTEVNVLDEILENTADMYDELAAEIHDEEKRGKSGGPDKKILSAKHSKINSHNSQGGSKKTDTLKKKPTLTSKKTSRTNGKATTVKASGEAPGKSNSSWDEAKTIVAQDSANSKLPTKSPVKDIITKSQGVSNEKVIAGKKPGPKSTAASSPLATTSPAKINPLKATTIKSKPKTEPVAVTVEKEQEKAEVFDAKSVASDQSSSTNISTSDVSTPLTSTTYSSSASSDDEGNAASEKKSTEKKINKSRSGKKRKISPIVYDGKQSPDSTGERAVKKARPVGMMSKKEYYARLRYLFRDARFFIMKSNNHENVAIGKKQGVWSTPPANDARLNQAFKETRNVLLIYSVKESGKFQGFARMTTESNRDVSAVPWVLPPGLSARALGGVFQLDWICKRELSFTRTDYLYNPWNEAKPVKICRDGQEVEPKVGEELCRLFPQDDDVDITEIMRKSRRHSKSIPSKGGHSDVGDERHQKRPLAGGPIGVRGPMPLFRGGNRGFHSGPSGPRGGRGGGGGFPLMRGGRLDLMRRRRFPDDFSNGPPKHMRRHFDDGYDMGNFRERRGGGFRTRGIRPLGGGKMYSDYMSPRERGPHMLMGGSYSPQHYPPMEIGPRYYDQPLGGMEEDHERYSPPRRRTPPLRHRYPPVDKRAYERSVDEFLRRTSSGSRRHRREKGASSGSDDSRSYRRIGRRERR